MFELQILGLMVGLFFFAGVCGMDPRRSVRPPRRETER
jgi:hypothetical protein